ncbi:restriction endonuclease subunit S [Endozoicomonas ascidiicola]|uniref:restriction endonuclease subunit S n=1 Tax=Endozoicomonas ascidiicola TaxID=1698521 RepID=UPI00082DBE03|nr:restriction endonuclease subunit S [Endozoicomonas ascidiicola]
MEVEIERYKESSIGIIPEDWECKTLSELCSHVMDGTHFTPTYVEKGVPFYSVENVTSGNFSRTKYVSEDAHELMCRRVRPEKGDILMTRIGSVGMTRLIDWDVNASIYVSLALLRTKSSITPEFLQQYSCSEWFKKDILSRSLLNATPMKINLGEIRYISCPVPPLPEQKKIARILSSVDSKLALIDQQITTTKTLKKGLMQKLFSQGVGTQDADGQWQPHTEFQDTELGRIPKGWAISKLDDLTNRGSGHTPDKQRPDYWDGGIKWVSLADSSRLDNGLIKTTDKEISALGIAKSSAVLHPEGTVVLSRDAGIGKSAVMGEDMAVSQHFIAWSCAPKGKLNNWYLYYLLQLFKPEFERIAIGSTIKTIGLPYFKKFTIAHPVDMNEQDEIAQVLLTVDRKLRHLQSQKSQTQQLKKGLMQKLLTGQIRVKPDPQDV